MKKLILSLATAIIIALLGFIGFKTFFKDGPREKVEIRKGVKVVSEELSFYSHSDKIYGKVFFPADENGRYPDSLGTRPVVIFFHEALKPSAAENAARTISGSGLICYVTAAADKTQNVREVLKKVSDQAFADKDRIYLVCWGDGQDAVLESLGKIKKSIEGLVTVGTSFSGAKVPSTGFPILETTPEDAVDDILGYLEERGGLK